MNQPVNICTNHNCEQPIFKGDQVWHRGKDLFCKLSCLAQQMKEETK
jgi:hypothetical protein